MHSLLGSSTLHRIWISLQAIMAVARSPDQVMAALEARMDGIENV